MVYNITCRKLIRTLQTLVIMTAEKLRSIKEHASVKYALKFLGWMIVVGIAIGFANEYLALAGKK